MCLFVLPWCSLLPLSLLLMLLLRRGDCHFVPGMGPYCFAAPNSSRVVPCKRCCSEFTPVFIQVPDKSRSGLSRDQCA